MNLTHLSESQFARLFSLSESGMGYQEIFVNNMRYFIVINLQYIVTNFEEAGNLPLIVNVEEITRDTIESDIDLSGVQATVNPIFNSLGPTPPNTLPPYTAITQNGDVFYRLSAFRNDRRILQDGSIPNRTYATTRNDLSVVPSGGAAVGRFALPTRLPAVHVFEIRPPVGTTYMYGTVLPNYGLAGGGVEVMFPYGCAPRSAIYSHAIPII